MPRSPCVSPAMWFCNTFPLRSCTSSRGSFYFLFRNCFFSSLVLLPLTRMSLDQRRKEDLTVKSWSWSVYHFINTHQPTNQPSARVCTTFGKLFILKLTTPNPLYMFALPLLLLLLLNWITLGNTLTQNRQKLVKQFIKSVCALLSENYHPVLLAPVWRGWTFKFQSWEEKRKRKLGPPSFTFVLK